MIVALIKNKQKYQYVIDELVEHQGAEICGTILELERWLEIHSAPNGLVIELEDETLETFLIRFALRYSKTPVLTLVSSPKQRILLRLRAFLENVKTSEKSQFKGRLLFVDDSATMRKKYGKFLASHAYKVDCAENADEAFDFAMKHRYELAIIDFFMPGRTGAELCEQIKNTEETYDLQCAILTAEYKEKVVDVCLKAGARECMFKNESLDLFLTRIKALIRTVERKRQIENERTRLISLINSVAEGVYGVTPEGRIQFVNPATLTLLGRSLSELMGQYPHNCIHPIDSAGERTSFTHCFMQQAYMFQDELRDWRTLFQRADGSLFPVECSVTKLGGNSEHGINTGSVVVFRDISEQQRLEKSWQWQLNHDHLTGLLNRSAFEEIVVSECNRLRRNKDQALLLFIDLDKFKVINDELGHAAGDQLLINLSNSLTERARETDHVARLAGDEFVVLLTSITDEEIEELAEHYRKLLEECNLSWEGKTYNVTGSIGAVVLDKDAQAFEEMLARADHACARAKQKGRNQWAIYESSEEEASQSGNWFQRLEKAIANEQFTLVNQAVFDANDTSKIRGFCYFLRMKEGMSLISPVMFLSNANRFGMMKKIEAHMLSSLVAWCKEQGGNETQKPWHAITLSIEALSDPEFHEQIESQWQASGLKPEQLCIQISEEDLFRFQNWQHHLNSLRQRDFKILINNFGMNTQSLLNLQQQPIDAIRLDTMLTNELAVSCARSNLIDAIVKTAHQSKIKVFATHVESSAELELIQARSIDLVQGFYLSKPVANNQTQD